MGFESIFKRKSEEKKINTAETSDVELLKELRASRQHYYEVSALSESRLENQNYTGSIEKQELEKEVENYKKKLEEIDAQILEIKKKAI